MRSVVELTSQLTMVAAQVMGNHTTITVAGSYGQFEVRRRLCCVGNQVLLA